jgi:hypothetical protein
VLFSFPRANTIHVPPADTARHALQLLAAATDFWYRHLKPAWHVTDAEAAASSGPVVELAPSSDRWPALLADLKALEPGGDPANVALLRALSAEAHGRVQLVRTW